MREANAIMSFRRTFTVLARGGPVTQAYHARIAAGNLQSCSSRRRSAPLKYVELVHSPTYVTFYMRTYSPRFLIEKMASRGPVANAVATGATKYSAQTRGCSSYNNVVKKQRVKYHPRILVLCRLFRAQKSAYRCRIFRNLELRLW